MPSNPLPSSARSALREAAPTTTFEQYWDELAAMLNISPDNPHAINARALIRELAERTGTPPIDAGDNKRREEARDALASSRAAAGTIREAVEALPGNGWRSIYTAPKDGTHILACNAWASFGTAADSPPVQSVVHWWANPGEEGFYTSVNELEPQRPFVASHWKPLDAPRTRGVIVTDPTHCSCEEPDVHRYVNEPTHLFCTLCELDMPAASSPTGGTTE